LSADDVPAHARDPASVRRTLDAVWRMESAKILGGLTRFLRDVGLAEDLAQEAFVAALEQWPRDGVPDNPGAWLMASAKHRAIDLVRHRSLHQRKEAEIAWELDTAHRDAEERLAAAIDAAFDDPIGDDTLRLVFIACHPVLSKEARVALTLRLLGGLSTGEIARAFLVPEATIAQRIVRAKRTLAEARVPFEVPAAADLDARLDSVLEAIYLIFNEGYAATAGEDWVRPALCDDALRLGRVLAGRMADVSEVQGLVALMELQASRLRARTGADGEPVLLADQDRSRWDRILVQRGLAELERANAGAEAAGGLGPYALQAAIAACHATAASVADTDWPRIVAIYDALAALVPSPVIELNRAVAVGMAYGPAAALALVDALRDAPQLARYHLLPGVRADLLEKLGRHDEARAEFLRAAGMTRNARERALLERRAAAGGT
jgi:RNA polymerase sigma factor (sigma-70 family)